MERTTTGLIDPLEFARTQNERIKRYALAFADKHQFVTFPLYGIRQDGSCSCLKGNDCKAKGKHPILAWREITSADPLKTAARFKGPASGSRPINLGLSCGALSNLTVIDVDGDVGKQSFKRFQEKHGTFPATAVVNTGRGFHLFFKHCPELDTFTHLHEIDPDGEAFPNIELRREGNYVVTIGSRHRNGNYYELRKGLKISERAAAPEFLVKLGREALGRNAKGKTLARPKGKGTDHFVNMLQYTPEGERNNALASLTGKLLHDGLSASIVYEIMRIWNQTSVDPPIDEDEFNASFKSILKRDKQKRQEQILSEFKKLD